MIGTNIIIIIIIIIIVALFVLFFKCFLNKYASFVMSKRPLLNYAPPTPYLRALCFFYISNKI